VVAKTIIDDIFERDGEIIIIEMVAEKSEVKVTEIPEMIDNLLL
jgi:hypothetical protein